jgi:hypothetical protein
MTVTTTRPAPRPASHSAARTVLPFEPLPAELQPFRRSALPDRVEAQRLLKQGLVRTVIADVLVAFDAPDSRDSRLAATALLVPPEARGDDGWVVAFGSAAWLHTGSGGIDRPAPAELHVIIPPGRRRPRAAGIRGRQVALPPEHVMFLDGIAVTDPLRTAVDVARDLPTAEALDALRRLGELTGVRPDQVLTLLASMRYARGAATARHLVKN